MATSELFSLEGKTAVVTGGSRGIGYAIAKGFIESGARVIITARTEAQLQEAATSLGANAIGIRCDNADPAQIEATCAEAFRFGTPEILVNNAGISPFFKRTEHVTIEDFDSVVQVNLRGTFLWSIEFAKRLFAANAPGSIMAVSSVLGVVPQERLAPYGMTKAGIHQLVKTMAVEWADRNVRVNAIAPGYTDTDFTSDLLASRWREKIMAPIPMQRVATPDEIVGAAIYLASAASSYVTGTIMLVDGGRGAN